MFSWNQLGWWVYNLPTHLKRWFVQLTRACLYGSPRPSRNAWSTAFHAAFEARFPHWNAFMLAQNEHQRGYLVTYWRDLETAFMALRLKELRPLDIELNVWANSHLAKLLLDDRGPGFRVAWAYDFWKPEGATRELRVTAA